MAKKVTKSKSNHEESQSKPADQPVASSTATPKSKGAAKAKPTSPPSPPPMDVDELLDSPDESDGEDAETENANGAPIAEWPKEDDLELISRIRAAIPKDDQTKYDTRVNQLDFSKIKFGVYSTEDCKSRWTHMMGHLRHFRILSEVLNDAVTWRNEHPWYNFNKGGKATLKHPDLPKKPLTSYMLFYMEQKHIAAQENPGVGMTELSKHVAKMYNSLSEKKKQKYVQMAEQKKLEYNKEMNKFIEEHPDYNPPKSASKFGSKAVPPKLPTPLKFYTDATMPKLLKTGISATEARNQCSKTYRELNDKQKMKWINMALEAESSYNEELAKFRTEHPEVDLSTKKAALLTKDEVQIKDKYNGKPEKPPNSGYSLYSKELLSSDRLKSFESKERMTEISRMWKELGEKEKTDFNDRANALNHQYKMKYAAYLESLTPEQRSAELVLTLSKGMKRPNAKKLDDEGDAKKLKKDDDSDSTDDEAGDDDIEAPKKPAIQKPNSSMQKFIDLNKNKFHKKFPKMEGQDFTRFMAKEYAKLNDEEKKKYEAMAQQSKNESAAPVPKSPPKSAKSKATATASTSVSKPTSSTKKPAAVATATLSPASKPGPASKKASASANGSTSKTTKAAASKTSTNKKQPTVPEWAEKFPVMFPDEPLKPHANVKVYYAGTKKKSGLTEDELEELWGSISSKQQKKITADHSKKLSEYSETFEKYVRKLKPNDMEKFLVIISERKNPTSQAESDEESGDEEDGSSVEENNAEGTSSEDDISD